MRSRTSLTCDWGECCGCRWWIPLELWHSCILGLISTCIDAHFFSLLIFFVGKFGLQFDNLTWNSFWILLWCGHQDCVLAVLLSGPWSISFDDTARFWWQFHTGWVWWLCQWNSLCLRSKLPEFCG
jgi:hypothetical protein